MKIFAIPLLLLTSLAWGQGTTIEAKTTVFGGTSILSGLTAAATPTFSPAAGNVTAATSVTISTATGGCSSYIYWNTTGINLVAGTNSTSFTVSGSGTWYAQVIGCPGYGNSAIASAAYVVNKVAPVGTPICQTRIAYGTSATLNYTPQAAGDTILVYSTNSSTDATTSVTDNLSSTYTNVATNTTIVGLSWWGILSAPTGMTSVTVNVAGSTYIDVCVAEFDNGTLGTGVVAFGHTLLTGVWTSSTSYTSSVTTQDPYNYVVAGMWNFDSTVAPVAATAGTILASFYATSADSIWIQGNTSATAGSVTNSGTLSSTSGNITALELRSQ